MSQSASVQTPRKPDSDILHDVARELAWDTRISPTGVGIQVKNGVVTFTGTVDSWAKLRAAQDAAHRVAGVLDVANDLVVKPTGSVERTDTEIAQAVRRALEWDVREHAVGRALERHAEREAGRIQLQAADGTVNVTGVVHSLHEKEAVLGAVRGTRGVRHVADDLRIEPRR